MRLPDPPEKYDREHQSDVQVRLEAEDRANHKRGRDIDVSPGRLILTSPDGTRHSITVDNSGVITNCGDVDGPASAVSGNIPIFSGITGKIIADGGKGLPAGAIVGTTDAQTLANKTITTPTIGDFSNAQHSHTSAATGGLLTIGSLSGLGANVASFLSAPSSSNLAAAVTDETGTGALVFATAPTLVSPALGTPASGALTNCTSIPAGQLTGTIPSSVLGGSSLFVGTTSTALNRASANQALTGISSVSFPGATSGVTTLQPSAVAGSTALTLPAATDTLVGKATTDTFTNKTFDTAASGNILRVNGTQVSAVTGSGSVVLSSSPSLTTPNIGAATGTSLAATGGSVTVRAAAAQDAVVLAGRAGGTGSFGVSLTPTTLTASRTVTLADGDTTLQAGTMATTGGTLSQFAATTSAQLAGVVSDETGSGSLVFANTPTLVTPNIGAATGTSLAATGGSVTVRAAATQDAVVLTGRAGGTSSFGVTLTPTTLTASRTVTLADGNTTLQAGTMAITGGTLAQFAATTSAQLAGVISDETGSGSLVFANTPTLVTPNIGAATGTSLAATGGSVTVRAAATQDAVSLTGRAGGTSSFGVTLTPAALTASRTVTLADGDTTLQAGTMAITGGTLAQFAATTSAQLAGVISDETGSGSLVFGTSPTIATPTITTSATAPLVIGGTGTTSTLTLRSTSGVGTTGADIIFQAGSNGGTELMRLRNNGTVGIKTASPQVPLHTINGTQITAVPGAGTYGGPVIIGNDNTLYGVYIGSISSGAGYIQQQRGDSAVTYPLLLQPNGDNVLIGYTTSNGAYKLQVNSQIFATSATIATSDRRYKKNVVPLQDGLNIVNALQPVTFDWRKHKVHNFDTENRQIGFIAQDIRAALANSEYQDCVVKTNTCIVDDVDEKFLGVCDTALIPVLTKAIQELSAQVEALAARVRDLETSTSGTSPVPNTL